MHDGDHAGPACGTRRIVAFEPLPGGPGVDIAGGYSRAMWRPRLGSAVWALWVAVGTRLSTSGPFACRVGAGGLASLGDADALDRALVELSCHGLARAAGEGRWEVRTTCPVPVSSAPPGTKAGAVRHYQQLAAGARLDRWRRSHAPAGVGRARAFPADPDEAVEAVDVAELVGPEVGAAHGVHARAAAGRQSGEPAEVIKLSAWRRHRRIERMRVAGDD
ncbi:MAG TPA: hypothetical protein VIL48_17050 [Acidimicrobiales bacterium]